jgi:hypothetical protein
MAGSCENGDHSSGGSGSVRGPFISSKRLFQVSRQRAKDRNPVRKRWVAYASKIPPSPPEGRKKQALRRFCIARHVRQIQEKQR